MNQNELKLQPIIKESTSSHNYQELYICFVSEFPGVEFTTKEIYSELDFAEAYIGVYQAGAQRHYYRVKFERNGEKSLVSLQKAASRHARISPEKVWKTVEGCL